MELTIPHGLGREGAKQKLEELARKHDVAIEPDAGGFGGTIEKKAPLVGKVRASYTVNEADVHVTVTQAPKLLPEATLRRMIEEELGRELA